MCGIAGTYDMRREGRVDPSVVERMGATLTHRGPDDAGRFVHQNVGLAFRRLAIIDLEGGNQPICNEDSSLVLMCNGEIFNYRELRSQLLARGHQFRTNCDVEVIVHLYEEYGTGCLDKLNGQFAFVIYDKENDSLFLARDHFGINPLFYTESNGVFIFASEIKAILECPSVEREVDLTALDQILSFPGVVSPRTMFKNVSSLPGGHFITVKNGDLQISRYWDLDYPREGEISYDKSESYYVENLRAILEQSVKYRLQADVPVGLYLSGGLDSSIITSLARQFSDERRHSFSINFTDKEISESKYQELVARNTESEHHEILFDWKEISERLRHVIYHCECPLKESFDTCSMALSEAAKSNGVTVVLAGEGADELFAGYVGYRFDHLGNRGLPPTYFEQVMEEDLRERLWGDRNLFYETSLYALHEIKTTLYSSALNEQFYEFDCLGFGLVDKNLLEGRHFIHQRSYLDVKLRLSDHLLSEHGDRMALASSVEARYPFLDINLVEFAKTIPPGLKLNQHVEKYILKKLAMGMLPEEIINREKFGFRAPGSPYLMRQNIEWVNDLLSSELIKKQGYFDPQVVESLKKEYSKNNFALHPHLESDLLMIVLTFGLFLELFKLPNLN
jgi:asparagine synthase (glutamine-hydrolysing)